MKNLIIPEPIPKSNIQKEESIGDCFSKQNEYSEHYYLVREDDVLHVSISNDGYCINQLFDNHITEQRVEYGEKLEKIPRDVLNMVLNEAIFEMNLFSEKNKVNED